MEARSRTARELIPGTPPPFPPLRGTEKRNPYFWSSCLGKGSSSNVIECILIGFRIRPTCAGGGSFSATEGRVARGQPDPSLCNSRKRCPSEKETLPRGKGFQDVLHCSCADGPWRIMRRGACVPEKEELASAVG